MKLEIYNTEYWIKDGIELPLYFDLMNDDGKWNYIYENKLLHREDGPAEIWPDGTKWWLLNGQIHRLDGPAFITSGGYQFWYLNNIFVDGEIYKKIQICPKEKLLVYMVDSEYKDYLPLIEYRLNQ